MIPKFEARIGNTMGGVSSADRRGQVGNGTPTCVVPPTGSGQGRQSHGAEQMERDGNRKQCRLPCRPVKVSGIKEVNDLHAIF